MGIKEKLDKLPEKELKEFLEGNKYVKEGSIGMFKKNASNIVKILLRKNNILICEESKGSLGSGKLEDFTLLTYDLYKDVNIRKYDGSIVINSAKKLGEFLAKTLSKKFGENYGIVLEPGGLKLTIYYPKIKISNSLGIEHELLEVYLSLYIGFDGITFRLKDFSLFRACYTLEEYYNDGYMFSHISSNRQYKDAFKHCWCLGYSAFQDYITNCEAELSPRDIIFLITQFHSYLQWESIEGTPYRYLVSLKSYNTAKIDVGSVKIEDMQEIYNFTIKNISDFKYKIIVSYDYSIKLTEESIKNIGDLLTENYPNLSYIVMGEGPVEIIPLKMPEHLPTATINFKGELKHIRLIESNSGEESIKILKDTYKKQILPSILNSIVEEIERNFTKYYVNKKLEEL